MARRGNPEQNPTLRGRRLAMELQRRREATGMSREEVARQLEWSTSTIFRIETGRSRPQPGNVRMLLELYGVTGPERDGLIQLTREARQPGWWHSFRDVLPNPYEVYIGLEAGAASIRNFEPIVVPGLLQTEDYARETFRNGPIELDPDEVERLVEVRLARQKILTRDDRPRLWAVIDEAVIRRVVGGTEVMRGQLRHLADSRPAGQDHHPGRALPCRRTRRDHRSVRHPGLPGAHRPGRGVRRDARRGHLSRRAFGREPLYPCI